MPFLRYLNRALFLSVVLNSFCLATSPSRTARTEHAQSIETQAFLLSSISYRSNISAAGDQEEADSERFTKEIVRGQLQWHQKTADKMKLEIEFVSFEYLAQPKEVPAFLQKKPFNAMITIDPDQQPNLSISISPQDPPPNSFLQQSMHGMIVTMLEMMLPPAVDRKMTVSPDGKHLSMEVFFPEKALIEYEQKPVSVDITAIRSVRTPTTFSCRPVLEDGRRSAWLLSDLSATSRTVKYFSRYLDEASGLATRAVNLRFAVPKKAEKANIVDLIDGLGPGQPNPYKYYYSNELELKKRGVSK